MPGLGHLPTDLAVQLASSLSQTVHTGLTNSLEDAEAAAILRHLRQQFGDVLRSELQEKNLAKNSVAASRLTRRT